MSRVTLCKIFLLRVFFSSNFVLKSNTWPFFVVSLTFCHGLQLMSRVKFGKIFTAIVTGFFGPKNCHGLLGAPRASFWKIATGYSKNVTGKKKKHCSRTHASTYFPHGLGLHSIREKYTVFDYFNLTLGINKGGWGHIHLRSNCFYSLISGLGNVYDTFKTFLWKRPFWTLKNVWRIH